MDVLIVCPANCATGGPECLHEFTSELNKIDGVYARLWYWDIKSYPPMPEEYKSYGCEYVTEMPEGFDGYVVLPEIWANKALDYPKAAIYWLGLDAYAGWNLHDRGAFLANENIIHIAQSEYAYDFLRMLKVRHLFKCVDVLNADFYEDYAEEERSDAVLYNPAKSTPFMQRLMAECHGIEFKPIQGMTRAEVIDAMRHSKLYIDFGEFPGRERIPREAALCGCHFYKYDNKPSHVWAIIRKIRYVLDNYTECKRDFDRFREDLIEDRTRIQWQTEVIANVFQHYHPRA